VAQARFAPLPSLWRLLLDRNLIKIDRGRTNTQEQEFHGVAAI
jgi:hypothetical protein